MATARIVKAQRFFGTAAAPGDKSISHRALIFGALGSGPVEVRNLAPGADVRSTARCLESLGAKLRLEGSTAFIAGQRLDGLRPPTALLDCGNSGTTMRLLCGVVAGARTGGTLDGDESLRRRPMRRVLEPLRRMGAVAQAKRSIGGDETAPLRFEPGRGLVAQRHELPVASAQVKSCLLLAGLWTSGRTSVREPYLSRDHTERMLRAFGASLHGLPDGAVAVDGPCGGLRLPEQLSVPGDPSSAAFLATGALITGGEVTVTGIDANPTRAGFLRVLERMGAQLELTPEPECAGEPVASWAVRQNGALRSTDVVADEIPSLIDEIPILAVLATQATGVTTIRGAEELRFKESDRLARVAKGLSAMGAEVQELDDGLTIRGPSALRGARIDAMGDHRIAMSFAIAGLAAEGETIIDGAQWADISFPGFYSLLAALSGGAVSSERDR